MATIFTHAVAALALGKAYTGRRMPWQFWALAAFCSILPDFDVAGFVFGVRYGDALGHRGFSHSLLFALMAGAAASWVFAREFPAFRARRASLALFFAAATASHGLLDALTDGGLGVAFFSPFDTRRYFLPWRPIEVSPIGLGFFTRYGVSVLVTELRWVWLPSTLLIAAAWLCRRASSRQSARAREEES